MNRQVKSKNTTVARLIMPVTVIICGTIGSKNRLIMYKNVCSVYSKYTAYPENNGSTIP
jgi:hypothetical protein